MKLRLGVIGGSEGNGHPYSWSAIFNGYNAEIMKTCAYPVIPLYLGQQKWPKSQIHEAEVTHIWTQDWNLSQHISESARINNVVNSAVEMIGEVDAILLARDDAVNHVEVAAPFLEEGLPVYIDKPICLSVDELDRLYDLQQYSGQIFSCSALRYAFELQLSPFEREKLGNLIQVHAMVPKDWDRYAVHAIEPLLVLAGDQGSIVAHKRWSHGDSVTNHYAWESGFQAAVSTMGAGCCPISLRVIGESGWKDLTFTDTFYAFRYALNEFVQGVINNDVRSDPLFLRSVVKMLELGRAR